MLSIVSLNRTRPKDFENDISRIDSGPTQKDPKDPEEDSNRQANRVMKNLSLVTGFNYNTTKRSSEKVRTLIKEHNEHVSIDKGEKLTVGAGQTNLSALPFSYDPQQPTVKHQNLDFVKVLEEPNLKEELVINSNAKAEIRDGNLQKRPSGEKKGVDQIKNKIE